MSAKPLPAADYLRECFVYSDGALYWAPRKAEHFRTNVGWVTHTRRFAGRLAGRVVKGPHSYWQVMLDGERYLVHRLIAAMHGLDTSGVIDHINGDSTDNRVENLRPCSVEQNTRNTAGWAKKKERVGVSAKGNNKWTAYIRESGRLKYLGTFYDYESAVAARVAAEKRVYGQFARQRT